MKTSTSFYSNRKFFGESHFPYGLERSGEFTRQQTELLLNHGFAFQALADGSREPATLEEETFVAVCQGKQLAQTSHEKVWQLYCLKTNAKPVFVKSPFNRSKAEVTNSSDIIDDYF